MTKDWQDAKPGEAWVLTFADYADVLGGAYIAGDWSFMTADHAVPIDDERITAGRRIFPGRS